MNVAKEMSTTDVKALVEYRLLDSLVIECWLRVLEGLGSILSQGPRHTKDFIKNGTSSSLV